MELEKCLNEKEIIIKTLKAQGTSDRNELEQLKEAALMWKNQLHLCKKVLKKYKEKNNQSAESLHFFNEVT